MFVGAHISASGGCLNAVANADRHLGPSARSFAFFVRPRLSWKPVAPIEHAVASEFRERLAQSRFDPSKIVVHGSYILNFGSHDGELRRKSVQLMVEEVSKCAQLGVPLYVFHPGSCTRVPPELAWTPSSRKPSKKLVDQLTNQREQDKEAHARAMSIQFISECMAEVLDQTQDVTLCIENMCGQGNVLGRNFDELRAMLDGVVANSAPSTTQRVGVCLDTCHAHASGYSMQTASDCDEMMRLFDEAMGENWCQQDVLKVIHVNDSMDACGSRRDRHENIGLGQIGLPAFEWLVNHRAFDELPMILETPRRGSESVRERVSRIADPRQRQLLSSWMEEEDSDANEIQFLLRLVHEDTTKRD